MTTPLQGWDSPVPDGDHQPTWLRLAGGFEASGYGLCDNRWR